MTETDILKRIMLTVGALPQVRIWRNNSGQAWSGAEIIHLPVRTRFLINGKSFLTETGDILIRQAHPVNFGLKGSGDLLGIIGPSGKLLVIEVKTETGRQSTQQKNFEKMIKDLGGIYILARSEKDALERLRKEGIYYGAG